MAARRTISPIAEFTAPVKKIGMAPKRRTPAIVRLGPKRSDRGPKAVLARIVEETEARLA
jgi:hypothetical protein